MDEGNKLTTGTKLIMQNEITFVTFLPSVTQLSLHF